MMQQEETSRSPGGHKLLLCCLAALFLMLSSGCVYLRLLKFRDQISHFVEFIEFRDVNGPTLTFKKPILKTGDVFWMFGLDATSTTNKNDQLVAFYDFAKCYTVDAMDREGGRYDVLTELRYEKNKLHLFHLPQRFNAVLDAKVLTEVFEEMDGAEVDRSETSTNWQLGSSSVLPHRQAVIDVLGKPLQTIEKEDSWELIYRYQLKPVSDRDEPPDFESLTVFKKSDDRLVNATIRCGRMHIHIHLKEQGQYNIKLKRTKK